MTATATKTRASGTTVSLPRTELQSAVLAAIKGVATRGTRPVLRNVRIGDGLVSGTDIEIRVDANISVMCDPFLVDCHRLAQILDAATGDDVRFTVKGTTVTIKSGKGEWTLPTEEVAEFPMWEPTGTTPVCRLPADQFRRTVKATVYATDSQSSRYALSGVLVEVVKGNPTWVATDGRRLSCVETQTDQDVDDRSVVVPARVLAVARDLAGGGAAQLMSNGKEIVLELDGVTVTAMLVDGKFPPSWRDLVKKPDDTPSVLEVAALRDAVSAARIVTSEASKGVDLKWSGAKLELSAKSSEYGKATVECPLSSAGTTSNTKLDPAFLLEFLKNIDHDEDPEVKVYAANPGDRVLLKCGPYTGVIMPLAADA